MQNDDGYYPLTTAQKEHEKDCDVEDDETIAEHIGLSSNNANINSAQQADASPDVPLIKQFLDEQKKASGEILNSRIQLPNVPHISKIRTFEKDATKNWNPISMLSSPFRKNNSKNSQQNKDAQPTKSTVGKHITLPSSIIQQTNTYQQNTQTSTNAIEKVPTSKITQPTPIHISPIQTPPIHTAQIQTQAPIIGTKPQLNPLIKTEREGPEEKPQIAMRTYQKDIVDHIKNKKASLTEITLADQKRNIKRAKATYTSTVAQKQSGGSVFAKVILFFFATIVLSLGVVYYYYSIQNKPAVVNNVRVLPLIFSDKQTEIKIQAETNRREFIILIRKQINDLNLTLGSIEHVYFTQGNGTIKRLLTSLEFLSKLETSLPTSVSRTLDSNFMFGIHVFDGNQPFLIFKTNFFENAFSGMLEWEEDIEFDIGEFFIKQIDQKDRASSDGLSSVARSFKQRKFEDLVLFNRDTRVLRNDKGKIDFLYSFPDRQTIIITTNENTFKEVLLRLTRYTN